MALCFSVGGGAVREAVVKATDFGIRELALRRIQGLVHMENKLSDVGKLAIVRKIKKTGDMPIFCSWRMLSACDQDHVIRPDAAGESRRITGIRKQGLDLTLQIRNLCYAVS